MSLNEVEKTLDSTMEKLTSIDVLYCKSDHYGKRKLIGLIYSEKFTFEDLKVRTAKTGDIFSFIGFKIGLGGTTPYHVLISDVQGNEPYAKLNGVNTFNGVQIFKSGGTNSAFMKYSNDQLNSPGSYNYLDFSGNTALRFYRPTGSGLDNYQFIVGGYSTPSIQNMTTGDNLIFPTSSGTIAKLSDIAGVGTGYAKLNGGNTFTGDQTITSGLQVSNQATFQSNIAIIGSGGNAMLIYGDGGQTIRFEDPTGSKDLKYSSTSHRLQFGPANSATEVLAYQSDITTAGAGYAKLSGGNVINDYQTFSGGVGIMGSVNIQTSNGGAADFSIKNGEIALYDQLKAPNPTIDQRIRISNWANNLQIFRNDRTVNFNFDLNTGNISRSGSGTISAKVLFDTDGIRRLVKPMSFPRISLLSDRVQHQLD